MFELRKMISALIIHEKTGRMLHRPTICHCPRVGDEIRLSENDYYKVTSVVWVFDEPENEQTRVNIGVLPVDEQNA